jgi:hypothetical protein
MKRPYKISLAVIVTLIVIVAAGLVWWTMFGKYYPVTKNEIFGLVALVSLGFVVGSSAGYFSAKRGYRLSSTLIGAFSASVAPSLLAIPWIYSRAQLLHEEFSLTQAISATLLFICPSVALVSGMTSLFSCGLLYTLFKECPQPQNKTT